MSGSIQRAENWPTSSQDPQNNSAMSKRCAIKQRIQQYYFQLTEGCGQNYCNNPDCASNPNFEKLSSDDAAARSIVLFKNKANFCEKPPAKIARTDLNHEEMSRSSENTAITSTASIETEASTSCGDTEMTDCSNDKRKPECLDTDVNSSGNVTSRQTDERTRANATSGCAENINKKLKQISVTDGSEITSIPTEQADSATLKKIESHCEILKKVDKLDYSDEKNGVFVSLQQAIWSVFSNADNLNRFMVSKEELKSQIHLDEDKDVDETEMNVLETPIETMSVDDTPTCSGKSHPEKLSMDDIDEDVTADDNKMETSASTQKVIEDSNKITVDVPSCSKQRQDFCPTVNMESVIHVYKHCSSHMQLERVMLNAVCYLINDLHNQLKATPNLYEKDKNFLNTFVILMENCAIHTPHGLNTAFPSFCKLIASLPIPAQAGLAKYWSTYSRDHLRNILENLQQLITFKVVTEVDNDEVIAQYAHTNEAIIAASRCLNVIYCASMLGGTINREIDESGRDASAEQKLNWSKDEDEFDLGLIDGTDERFQFDWVDSLAEELKLTKLDIVKPLVPFEEFINEPLNEHVQIDKDYANYRISQQLHDKKQTIPNKFSFLHYPFLLTTVNKTTYLFYDNRVRMFSERRRTLVSSLMQGSFIHPYLKIQVRRSHIIDDTLIQLEVASENVKDFKKQLYVEFDGEEGVDEGGVSKEFFQLVVDKIFDPGNGMFVYDDDTRLFWFNAYSFEALTQYKLIGIVLGLAIYNNCILDINFPTFVYKKLLGRKADFDDMAISHPVIHKSLCELLEYEGNVEEDLMATFCIEYQDIYGIQHTHDLKEGAESIPVTNDNRREYVDLYADWLLNTSVSAQFNAFLCGFDMVVNESPLKYLFDSNELELLIRGSENYDFDELERSTEYDGGFEKHSQTIRDFWAVVHDLSDVNKRTLLQFTTGSDRAPMGGLSKLKMIIARNGPDSDRLPTAHTCFNVILLPDYKDREKLKERLLKAIKYSKGFGML
ncbi:unnamed protein product [Clavelina lepadiformis]|uniref:HECT-type E3 ubiquitin transferase n=1 Tax=Clavelina lepadiformis TaxID=159417 RepID=A0ABP0FX70_CLALP